MTNVAGGVSSVAPVQERGPKLAFQIRMKQLVSNFLGCAASFLFLTVATVLWGCTAVCVWVSGNGSLAGRG